MSKLNVDQQTIKELFQDKKADFLIPDYQRPYAWGEDECQTLWDDIFTFAIPDGDAYSFDSDSEYFLGPIVTFKNESNKKKEVIDGQQRLTTLMLLLRAFYKSFNFAKDTNSEQTRKDIESCIWKTDEFGNPDKNKLKIDSEVVSDKYKEEFLDILKNGEAKAEYKSRYAENYRYFEKCIDEFSKSYPMYFAYLPNRIMKNCILLPIEAESQDTALRIFSTLNDRGKPLSDADIFKAQFYKFYTKIGKKDEFIKKWKELEELADKIFHPQSGTPMDELFTRYMYFERAKLNIKSSTTEALRKFYEKNNYILLNNEETFENLNVLAHFWESISKQDEDRFSERILKKLFVLNYAPNGMWSYFVSVYFMQNKDANGLLDEKKFYDFLNKTIAFIWTYALINPGVNSLRTPIYSEMINIVNGNEVTFNDFTFETTAVKNALENYSFNNQRPITKAMLSWWAYEDENQVLLSLDTNYEIEHIYAKKRQELEGTLTNPKNLESLGNKMILEKKINIRAADYKFADKCRYYKGFINGNRKQKEGTKVNELISLSNTLTDFTEKDIKARFTKIEDSWIIFLYSNNLIKN